MNAVKALVVTSIISMVSLAGCNYAEQKGTIEPFSDVIVKCVETPQYKAVLGVKAIYVLKGEYRTLGKIVRAGTALGYSSYSQFDLSQFIEKYPEYADDQVVKAARLQQKRMRKSHATREAPKAAG